MKPNPLLQNWSTPFELPPFGDIRDEDFPGAFEAALSDARSNIDRIAKQTEPASFENTIEALETADARLSKVCSVFFNLCASDSNESRRATETDISPKLAEYSADVTLNPRLYARLESLWERRCELGLNSEQQRVLELYKRDFVLSGAELEGEARERFRAIKKRLAELATKFTQNLLADESGWLMTLADDCLSGLPEFVVDAARQVAVDRKREGYSITLNRSNIVPFLQYSSERRLREIAFEAWCDRGANGGRNDNRKIAAEMLALRSELAQILGFSSYAALKLDTEMAESPAAVRDFLAAVWTPAKSRAETDARALRSMMNEDGISGRLKPWDWRYYAEKRRKAEHEIDEAGSKQYFQLDRMIEAAFHCAGRLFGLEFRQIEIPLYHPDCRAWEVLQDDRHIAVFIGDYFARPGKRSGAWSSSFRSQRKLGGEVRPVTVNVCNFAKPAKNRPCLLSFDDARTLFHEFGHALHSMLSDVTYERVSGTSVARDFVELPSQLFEHWLETPEVLAKFAVHAETGQPIPDSLLRKLLAARNFDQGFATVEYLASAIVDLEFHDSPPPEDLLAKQSEVLKSIGMPDTIRMRHAAPHFAHVFSGDGYAAGYYSYLWSEMMDADAFEYFLESGGPFSESAADALRTHILSAGGSKRPEDLYVAFRGKLPGAEAVLRKRGFESKQAQ